MKLPFCFAGLGLVLAVTMAGCQSPSAKIEMQKSIVSLRGDVSRLERLVEQRDATISRLARQVETLNTFDDERPADLFAPIKIEIASLSGGADYDGQPGDDGVTIHLRPRDAYGDVVKVPGRITIQLLDNTKIGAPQVLGVCEFNDPDQLQRAWHGRFGTNHYTLQCPFSDDAVLPANRKVTVNAEFTDFLTGTTLTTVKEVDISFPNP